MSSISSRIMKATTAGFIVSELLFGVCFAQDRRDAIQPMVVPQEPTKWTDTRISLRGGFDRIWELDEQKNVLGLDVAAVRRHAGYRHVRVEIGGTSSGALNDEQKLSVLNGHAEIFPALEMGPVVVGPRGLAGASWEERTDKVRPDVGGEGRVGLEAESFSVYFSAGRTLELTRIALDVGATF